jgi:hypothetical protein
MEGNHQLACWCLGDGQYWKFIRHSLVSFTLISIPSLRQVVVVVSVKLSKLTHKRSINILNI